MDSNCKSLSLSREPLVEPGFRLGICGKRQDTAQKGANAEEEYPSLAGSDHGPHYGLTPAVALLAETELPGSRLTVRGDRYHLSSRPARFRFPQEFSLPNPPANSIDRG